MPPEDGEDYNEAAKRKNPLDPNTVIESLVTAGKIDLSRGTADSRVVKM
jgi:hypothetical protein